MAAATASRLLLMRWTQVHEPAIETCTEFSDAIQLNRIRNFVCWLLPACRLVAAGGPADGDRLQLRLRAQLLQPHDGAPGLGMGRRLPAARRRRRMVRQLAPRRPPFRRRTEVHSLQGPHGLRIRYVRT